MVIRTITSRDEIALCFDVFAELRPHLYDQKAFIDQVCAQQKEGYCIQAVIEDSKSVACIGYRMMTTLAWGKIFYIDDLMTWSQCRGKGYGALLLQHVVEEARHQGCAQVHLDTGHTRHAAHRIYINHGFQFNCHHLALTL